SANGGRSFTDLGGLPNAHCKTDFYVSDPSVAAYRVGGSTYFYISSMYDSPNGTGSSMIAMTACKVTGAGSGATLACGQPVIIASSTFCMKEQIGPGQTATFCNFLDKDFITIDPAHHRLSRRSPSSRTTWAASAAGSSSGSAISAAPLVAAVRPAGPP